VVIRREPVLERDVLGSFFLLLLMVSSIVILRDKFDCIFCGRFRMKVAMFYFVCRSGDVAWMTGFVID